MLDATVSPVEILYPGGPEIGAEAAGGPDGSSVELTLAEGVTCALAAGFPACGIHPPGGVELAIVARLSSSDKPGCDGLLMFEGPDPGRDGVFATF